MTPKDSNPFEVKVSTPVPFKAIRTLLVLSSAALALVITPFWFISIHIAKKDFVSNQVNVCFANNLNELKLTDSASFSTIMLALGNPYVDAYLLGNIESNRRISSYYKEYQLYSVIPVMDSLRLQSSKCRHQASAEFYANTVDYTKKYFQKNPNILSRAILD